jgi:hypothetical protein
MPSSGYVLGINRKISSCCPSEASELIQAIILSAATFVVPYWEMAFPYLEIYRYYYPELSSIFGYFVAPHSDSAGLKELRIVVNSKYGATILSGSCPINILYVKVNFTKIEGTIRKFLNTIVAVHIIL